MNARARRLYLQDYIGLANRLESLALSFAIQAEHGHEIWLDWPELDALTVEGTRTGAPGLLGRLGALRLRECGPATFATLGRFPRILQRTYLGPDERLEPIHRETMERIRPRKAVVAEVRQLFESAPDRPVVGIHIRRGDFRLVGTGEYDANSTRHPAVPLWWYEAVMGAMVARQPDLRFYLAFSGDGSEFATLRKNFDILEARSPSPYTYKGPDHKAVRHPVVDLFALACCPALLGTPISSFSHYAAHLLGPPTACLLPPLRTKRTAWGVTQVDLRGKRLVHWVTACRTGAGTQRAPGEIGPITFGPANTAWLGLTAAAG